MEQRALYDGDTKSAATGEWETISNDTAIAQYDEQSSSTSSSSSSNSTTSSEGDQETRKRKALDGSSSHDPTSAPRRPTQPGRQARRKYDYAAVPWQRLQHTPHGSVPLTRYLPYFELDKILGWATHGTSHDGVMHPRQRSVASSFEDNPLLLQDDSSPSPLPPSMLMLLHELAAQELTVMTQAALLPAQQARYQDLWQAWDGSALVALGTVLQHAVTATILPLAVSHVQHCRQLERQHGLTQTVQDMWTLPPAEAMLQQAVLNPFQRPHGGPTPKLCGLPTAARPAIHLASSVPPYSIIHTPTTASMHRTARQRWCAEHGLRDCYVDRNSADLFGPILGKGANVLPPTE